VSFTELIYLFVISNEMKTIRITFHTVHKKKAYHNETYNV